MRSTASSFSVDEGETLGLVGESGCGKSVSMLSVMRLIPMPPGKIASGQVMFQGRDLLKVDDEEIRSVRGNKIAMVFQDPMTSLNPVLTIGTQIGEALELHLGMTKEQARKRSVELLKMVGIPEAEDRLDDYPHQFSGGMRQRVMIAMALSCSPQLLIADEPTTALDVTIQAQITDIVKRLETRTRHGDYLDHARPRRDCRSGGSHQRDVRRFYYRIVGDQRNCLAIPCTRTRWACLARFRAWTKSSKSKLTPIEGLPPDLIDMPKGCPIL